jgi:DNA-binding transcriptional ArsR family regulator
METPRSDQADTWRDRRSPESGLTRNHMVTYVAEMTDRSQPAFHAIADPTRRRILAVLAKEPLAVERLAEAFPVSRPAISKHLRVLREAGLVSCEAQGRTNVYRMDPEPLAAVRGWIEGLWAERLTLLKQLAERKT